jgi:hypothetical protein
MDVVAAAVIVLDRSLEVGERVDPVLFLAPISSHYNNIFRIVARVYIPIELLNPFLLCINDPLPADSKLAMASLILLVLVRVFCDWTQFEQSLEFLQLLFFDVQVEGCGLLLRTCWRGAEGFG